MFESREMKDLDMTQTFSANFQKNPKPIDFLTKKSSKRPKPQKILSEPADLCKFSDLIGQKMRTRKNLKVLALVKPESKVLDFWKGSKKPRFQSLNEKKEVWKEKELESFEFLDRRTPEFNMRKDDKVEMLSQVKTSEFSISVVKKAPEYKKVCENPQFRCKKIENPFNLPLIVKHPRFNSSEHRRNKGSENPGLSLNSSIEVESQTMSNSPVNQSLHHPLSILKKLEHFMQIENRPPKTCKQLPQFKRKFCMPKEFLTPSR
jgi:hypothetical protein